ncbi:hypothetical protein ACTQXY_12965 [Faecalimonas sp. LCP19S3_D12]
MPIPFIIGGIAAIAGVAGVGSGIHGGVKMKEANDTMKSAQRIQENAIEKFEKRNTETTELMDALGKQELEILNSFEQFSDLIEKIQGRPKFKAYDKEGINLLEYEAEELKKVSAGAGVLLGGIGGAAAGTAGGFAAAGVTTSAVMALGTASTGTAISTLSGVAATNATLAALGGGSLAAGGGGMALGSMVLGGATLGIGLLVGGVIFNATGSKLSDKADEAYSQARRTEKEVKKIVEYFDELSTVAEGFRTSLTNVEEQYMKRLSILDHIINFEEKTEWLEFSDKEKILTENTVLLVGLLYQMCKIQLVLKTEKEDELNHVNKVAVNQAVSNADQVINELNYVA